MLEFETPTHKTFVVPKAYVCVVYFSLGRKYGMIRYYSYTAPPLSSFSADFLDSWAGANAERRLCREMTRFKPPPSGHTGK